LFRHWVHPRHLGHQRHIKPIVNDQRLRYRFLLYSLPKRSDESKQKNLTLMTSSRHRKHAGLQQSMMTMKHRSSATQNATEFRTITCRTDPADHRPHHRKRMHSTGQGTKNLNHGVAEC
ncbi:hypothetical protein BDR03DRAFT_975367, partial [Suillus americanus]